MVGCCILGDGRDVAGRWFAEHLPGYRGSDWDAYLLFGSNADWQALPLPLVASGSTVIDKKDELAQAIAPWLGSPGPAPRSSGRATRRPPSSVGLVSEAARRPR